MRSMRRAESSDAAARFESLTRRIERMEAEADLAGPARAPGRSGREDASLEDEFSRLQGDSEVEAELERLKQSRRQG
jgi:phage shock protein A